jgi:copper oxidase (laccase) domain-containing protein
MNLARNVITALGPAIAAATILVGPAVIAQIARAL